MAKTLFVRFDLSPLSQAYVSYKVAARRLDPAAAAAPPPPDVIRRFSDFAWLRAALRAARPGCVVPPLPSKSVVAKYSASADFIESRRAALQVFCNRVVRFLRLKGGEK